ncbi:MAG TPA: TonB-dependent receptor [Chitinophagaceae bacterium]|jgi:outer membrane receptor protein involved in Fe transport|nr:TonB-dependent receptor [Chitinophagaceae bacterium]
MRRIFILTVFLLILSFVSFAQSKTGKIKGTVIDGNSKTIESSTITLLRSKDSSVVKMSAADKNGHFEFENISEGKYLVSISAIGHQKGYSETFEITVDKNSVDLKTIELIPQTKDLAGVTVTSKKPLIEQRMDRTIVNVDAAISNVGATALEVLEKSPGITIDKDGNISLKGKQGVQIYIDGRPSYLSGQDLVNLLKNMNASQLDQIEIMTNPPAKYDAAGNSGIINIKTKKNKQAGFNGNATAGYSQGKYWRTNESLNMNYRNGKFNAFMNAGYYKSYNYQELTIHRTYLRPDKTVNALFDQVAFMPRNNGGDNLKVGLDYFIDKKNTIGFVASGFLNREHQFNYNTSYLKNSSNEIDSIVYSTSDVKGKWKNGSFNLNFRHEYDSTGRELTTDLDYSRYSSTNGQLFTNASFNADGTKRGQTDLLGDVPVNTEIYSAKADYTHPLKKGSKFEAGVKSSYVNTDNASNYFNLLMADWQIDYKKTNRFLYKENINAAYFSFSKQYKKLGVQAGLRFENTNYKGHQLGNPQKADSTFSKNYNSLFPTIFLSYGASKNHQFGFNAGRRIDRPAYQDLNPFLFFLDNYTYESGNPFLKPQYTTNLELSHTYKGFLHTTLNYSRTKNFFTETFEQNHDTTGADKGFATIVRNGNIGVRHNAGISTSAQLNIAKWWSSSLYGNYNYSVFRGELYGEKISVEASNVLFNMNNQFKFKKGWGAELSGFYRSRGVEGQLVIEPLGQLSAGVSKQLLKGKGTVRLNIRDIFYTNWAKGHINFQSTEAKFENRRDTRVAGIAFTYRFGKPIKGPQNNRKKGGADDEQSRVKVGGNN